MTPAEVTQLERDWAGRVAITQPDAYFDWQPAPVPLFLSLLEACLPHVPAGNATFLDVGCGIGTKCLLASDAGLAVYGIDRVPEYVAAATDAGVDADLGRAETYGGYGRFGLVYVNHPLKSGGAEAELERVIGEAMAPGAVLMAVNCGTVPAGWPEVARAGDWHAGWVKP